MRNKIVKKLNRKIIFGFSVLLAILLFTSSNSFAANYVSLKIYPEHVGVFLSTGEQQFVCFGITATGARENITDKVDWISSDTRLVRFDQNGLAKIQPLITQGQVKVTCSYPKSGGVNTGPNHLLLGKPIRR